MKPSPTSKFVTKFAEEMEGKLSMNRHKGDREGWLSCDIHDLIAWLKQEVDELQDAILLNEDPIEIWKEAADVANFAMMIADRHEESQRGAA